MLQTVHWECTDKCNLNCKFCFAIFDGPMVSTGKAKGIINKVAEAKAKLLVFGGEPTLREDLEELLSYANSLGLKTAIDTNAVLVTESFLESVKGKVERVGLPLYGPEEVHDKMVGRKGHFKKILQVIELCKKHGITVKVNTAATKQNISFLKHVADVVRKYSIPLWTCLPFCPENRAIKYESLYEVSGEDYSKAIKELRKDYPLLRIDSPSNEKLERAYFFITSRGRIYSVVYHKKTFIGDLNKETISQILKKKAIDEGKYRQRFVDGV